jgi:hypothetical protein
MAKVRAKTGPKAKKPATKAAPKKPAAKKPAAKKTAANKPSAKKATPAKAAAKTANKKNIIAKFPKDIGKVDTRRPPNNPEMPMEFIGQIEHGFIEVRNHLEAYSAHLRALDRMRLNGVGLKKLGFIGRALLLAAENPEFLPHYVTLEKFQEDNNYFLALRSAFDVLRQVQEILWNIIIEASDVLYTDALEYYAGVREAAKRRVDPAETLYRDLFAFFKRGPRMEEEPTDKQIKRDVNGLIRGKKDGKVVIENVKPKLTGGKHEVIDETFKDTAAFKESEEGRIKE